MDKKIGLFCILQFVLLITSFSSISMWLVDRWIFTGMGLIGYLVFLLGGYYVSQRKGYFNPLGSVSKPYFLLSVFFFLLVFMLEYNILKSISFFVSILFSWLSFFRPSQDKIYLVMIWLFFSLPIIPLLGSSIGIFNRITYVYLIEFLMSPSKVVGTSLYDGNYQFSIDSGCSGVLSIYLLVCFWIIYSFKKEKIAFEPLFFVGFIFWVMNTFRVFFLYIVHNKFHYENLDNLDLFLGLLFFAVSLSLMYKKLEKL